MGFPILVRWHLYIESGPCIPCDVRANQALLTEPWEKSTSVDWVTTDSVNGISSLLYLRLKALRRYNPSYFFLSKYRYFLEQEVAYSDKNNQHTNSSLFFIFGRWPFKLQTVRWTDDGLQHICFTTPPWIKWYICEIRFIYVSSDKTRLLIDILLIRLAFTIIIPTCDTLHPTCNRCVT